MKLEALKLLVDARPALAQGHAASPAAGVLESVWALLTGCLPLYVSGIVRGDEDIDDGEVSSQSSKCW